MKGYQQGIPTEVRIKRLCGCGEEWLTCLRSDFCCCSCGAFIVVLAIIVLANLPGDAPCSECFFHVVDSALVFDM